jgi:predicted ribosomally synthesized peptide with SipW-like signal peptide
MKRILIGLMAILLVVGMVGAGTSAYFSSTVQSTSNDFTTGELTLKVGNTEEGATEVSVSDTWTTPANWAPGDTVEKTLFIKNNGTIPATYLFTDWQAPNDGSGNSTWTADQMLLADQIQVTALEVYIPGYTGPAGPSGAGWYNDLANFTSIDPTPGDGIITLKDLVQDYIWAYGEGVSPNGDGSCPPRNAAGGSFPQKKDQFGKCVRFITDSSLGGGYAPPAGQGGNPAIPANGGLLKYRMAFKLLETTGDAFQGKSLTMNVEFTAGQVLEQQD